LTGHGAASRHSGDGTYETSNPGDIDVSETIKLTAEDGFTLSAYRADPAGTPKGGVVVIQEIFGVNGHIRAEVDKFAGHGYAAIAPAVFERVRAGVELAYDEAGLEEGRGIVGELGVDTPLLDIKAAAAALEGVGRIGVVGYCWGGTIAWLTATRLALPSVSYYGGRTVGFLDETPQAPLLMHFGETDHAIPLSDVETIKARYPDIPIHIYAGAGHGFNCDQRASYNPEAAATALTRTLEFLTANVG
jgi:carboxymethylenebutenolidase